MKRNEHLFQFTGQQISKAALAEFEYHEARVDWWQTEQESAVAKAREAGVEVREYAVTGGKNFQVVIDPTAGARLTECANKINAHRQAADRFQIEAATYGTQAPRTYELQPDDVLYFRLCGGPRVE